MGYVAACRAELANDGICARDSVGQGLNGALTEEILLRKSRIKGSGTKLYRLAICSVEFHFLHCINIVEPWVVAGM